VFPRFREPSGCSDLYEVVDSSLDDIRYALSPTYTPEEIAMLDKQSTLATDVMGVQYLPGIRCFRPRVPLPRELFSPLLDFRGL
jgi:hypothetical protein